MRAGKKISADSFVQFLASKEINLLQSSTWRVLYTCRCLQNICLQSFIRRV